MMRSLSSGVSGLKAHQTAMDVIGNNIANVNTVGFKSSRTTFEEVFSDTLRGAGAPQDGRGGTNAQQVGLGTGVATVDNLMTRGGVNRTDNPDDLSIAADGGFFMVTDDPSALNKVYTRAGNFLRDQSGNLVTGTGYKVLGYAYDQNGTPASTLSPLSIPTSAVYPPQATNNTYDLTDINGNVIKDPATQLPLSDPSTSKQVKIGVEFEGNLDSSKGVGAVRENTFTVFDSLGNTHDVKATMACTAVGTGTQTWTVTFSDPTATSAASSPLQFAAGTSGTPAGTASYTLTFDSAGNIITNNTSAPPYVPVTLSGTGMQPASNLSFNISFAKLTAVKNGSSASAQNISGYKQGTLDSYTISPSGEIQGVFSNGKNRVLGRIALADFKNSSGLQKIGDNLFETTSNSGNPIIGTPGDGGFGQLNSGGLEMSNVDLAREFANMIVIERGFQANSKIISTADEMLQELTNLKR